MQTMAIQIQDDYVNDFMNYVNNHSEINRLFLNINNEMVKLLNYYKGSTLL